MTLLAFASAVLALLLAPGPTNTLIALAGARAGLRGALRLIPAEVLGYLTAVLPLGGFGAALMHWPQAGMGLKLAAAAWVLVLAVRLWRPGAAAAGVAAVGRGRVYLTTVLNPKALIFGLVLLPAPGAEGYLPRLAAFCTMVAAVAVLWGAAGALARTGLSGPRLMVVQRVAAGWLAFVALSLIGGVLRV
ncbi:hypothetical protein [Paenirhodobacter sp.]|uniref:hypothetical protein n=1 Tax=Paenirhodobacter sp. TaxID=1965326 RepID=UPI003B512FC8